MEKEKYPSPQTVFMVAGVIIILLCLGSAWLLYPIVSIFIPHSSGYIIGLLTGAIIFSVLVLIGLVIATSI